MVIYYIAGRNAKNGGHTFTMRMSNYKNQVEIDNQWVVPYSPVLSKTCKAHIMSSFILPSNPSGTFENTVIKVVIWLYLKYKI